MPCRVITPLYGKNKGTEVQSILYDDLLKAAHDDQNVADKFYFKAYSPEFMEEFGNWIEDPESVQGKVDENGEPLVDFVTNEAHIPGQENDIKYQKQSLRDLNDAFNKELIRFKVGKLDEGHVFNLGNPAAILRDSGFPDLPIELSANVLFDKSTQANHRFDVTDLFDLVKGIHIPDLVVYNSRLYNNPLIVTNIESNGKKINVALKLDKSVNGKSYKVNDIVTVFPRDRHQDLIKMLAQEMNNDNVRYVNKKRFLQWMESKATTAHGPSFYAETYSKVKKFIGEFQNSVSEDDVRFWQKFKAGEEESSLPDVNISLTEDGKKRAVINILNDLKSRFNLSYELVNKPKESWKGSFNPETGIVEVNMAHVGWDTPFHEYLHPFVELMRTKSPELHSALTKALMDSPEGRKVYNQVLRDYPELNGQQSMDEALVTFVGRLATKNLDENGQIKPQATPLHRAILRKVQEWLHNVLDSLLGKYNPIPSPKVRLNGSLQDLADFITYGDRLDLSGMETMGDLSIKYSKGPSDRYTFENVMGRIKDRVNVLSRIYKSRPNKTALEDELSVLNKLLDNEDEIASVHKFITGGIEYMNQVEARWQILTDILDSGQTMSKEAVAKNLTLLNEIKQLITLYQGLNDVYDTMSDEVRDLVGQDKIQELLDTRTKMRRITGNMRSYMLDFLTEWLYPYAEATNKNLEAKGRGDRVLSKEELRKQLDCAPKDIDVFQNWLGAAVSSSDAVSSLVAVALKDSMYESVNKSNDTAERLVEEYQKIRKRPIVDLGGKEEEEFNKQYLRYADSYERIGRNEDGTPIMGYVKRRAFHEEFLWDQFYKDKRAFFERLGPEPDPITEPVKHDNWRKGRAAWYRNERVRPDIKQYIENKKKELSEDKFKQWLFNNTRQVAIIPYDNGSSNYHYMSQLGLTYGTPDKNGYFRVYTVGELLLPVDKYRNSEYTRLIKDPYYAKLYGAYKSANDKYNRRKLNFGIIPQNDKAGKLVREIKASGLKNAGKTIKGAMIDSVSAHIQGTKVKNEFGEDEIVSNTIQRLDGTEVDEVPTPYTKFVDDKDLSTNLLESVLLFTQAANNYEAMTDLEPQVQALKTLLIGDKELGIDARDIRKTEGGVSKFINAITKKQVNKTQSKLANERLVTFINAVVYGDTRVRSVVKTPWGDIDMNKVSDKLAQLTSIQIMGLNLIGGVSNLALGNITTLGEGVSGRYYSTKDWALAKADYWKYMPEYLGKLRTGRKNMSFLGQLQEHYDAIQGEFIDHFGRKVSGARLNRHSIRNGLFAFQHGGEHEIQMSGLLAMMRGQKVRTQDGRTISLLEAYEMRDGRLQLKPDVIWSESDDSAFRNRLHAVNKELHGNYNSFDQGTLQRFWLGRLAIMFRKFLYTGFRTRYGAERVDYETGDVVRGYYRSFIKTIVDEGRDYGIWGAMKISGKALLKGGALDQRTDDQNYAFKKTVYEMGLLLTTALVMAAIGAAGDDDDEALRNIELQARRLNADLGQFISPYDFMRLLKTPAVSMSTLARILSAGQHLGTLETYKRASGTARKGDLKFVHDLEKLVPLYNQVEKVANPETQIRFYKGSGAFL